MITNEFRIKFHLPEASAKNIYDNIYHLNNTEINGNIMLIGVSNISMYKHFIETHYNINTLFIVDDEPIKWFINNIKSNINIKFVNIENFIETANMPKFDYIIQNPPYKKSLHLDFFEKGLELLKENGKMIIIEPAAWLINVRKNGQAKRYDEIKKKIEGHVKSVIIENYNKEFDTGLYTPFSITEIDFSKKYESIISNICGYTSTVNSIYDVNLIGNYNLIWSILNKITCDKVKNHIYTPNKSKKEKGAYYCKFSGIVGKGGCIIGAPTNGLSYYSDSMYVGKYCEQYIIPLFSKTYNNIANVPLKSIKRGATNGALSDKNAECITGTKQELENWKYFVFNNSLPLFINIVMTIDQHNNSLNYVPWLVDKQYTDKEIYKRFNFTKEEIELIENTVKKYERYSPWFKRYITGDTSIKINQKEPWKEIKQQ